MNVKPCCSRAPGSLLHSISPLILKESSLETAGRCYLQMSKERLIRAWSKLVLWKVPCRALPRAVRQSNFPNQLPKVWVTSVTTSNLGISTMLVLGSCTTTFFLTVWEQICAKGTALRGHKSQPGASLRNHRII